MFDRITFNSEIMSGQACVRGMRIPVSLIVNLIAVGKTNDEIIDEYPDISKECLEYAAWLSREQIIAL